LVGPVDAGAEVPQQLEGRRGRVAVVVVLADRDQGDGRAGGGQESPVLAAGAVVRDLEDVDVRDGRRQGALCLLFYVAGQHRAEARSAGDDDHAGVVDRGPVVPGREGTARMWGQDRQRQVAYAPLLARVGVPDGDAGGQARFSAGGPGGREDLLDGAAVPDAGRAADVVGVRVGQDQQRDLLDVEAAEASVDQRGIEIGRAHV